MHRRPMSSGSAFGLTLSAFGFTVAGLVGYSLQRTVGHPHGRWTDDAVPWEIGLGLLLAIAAAVAWRDVLRREPSLRDQRHRTNPHTLANIIIVGAVLAFVVWTAAFP